MTNSPNEHSTRLIWYAAVIFYSSACLLVLEIVASRLLAPYVGVSLYSWTAIIGVILAGLSLGNWIGGLSADRGSGVTTVGWVMVAAGLLTLVIPYLLVNLADYLQSRDISLLGASLVYVSVLFFMPAVVLGIITPLLTTMALGLSDRPGHIVGSMHALAALGSICGTFAAGFWLIPWYGTRHIIIVTGVSLIMVGCLFLLRRTRAVIAAVFLSAIVLGGVLAGKSLRSPCDVESLYYCIRVVEESSSYGPSSTMVIDHMVHSINHRDDPQLLIAPYTHTMDELLRFRFPASEQQDFRIFFAGGGAYTQPRALEARLPAGAHIEVAEIDPEVTAIARDRLFVDMQNMIVHDSDARLQLPQAPAGYFDAVVTDVFHDVAIPYHMTTVEFAGIVKSRLKPDGVYLLNVVDVFPDSNLVKAMIKTLAVHFKSVQVWLEKPPDQPTRLTYTISASNGAKFPSQINAQNGFSRSWYDITEPIKRIGIDMRDIPLLSDDFAPVERLVSTLFWTTMGS